MNELNVDETDIDLAALMGAELLQGQRLSLYIPSRAKTGRPINQRLWVEDALTLLAQVGGGATATPKYEGVWIDKENKKLLKDETIIVYCFIKVDLLQEHVKAIRGFMHGMGRMTDQDTVAFEFDGFFFIVNHENYDKD